MITSGGEAVEQVLEWFPSLNRLALKIDDREAVDLANGHLVLGAPSARDGRLTGVSRTKSVSACSKAPAEASPLSMPSRLAGIQKLSRFVVEIFAASPCIAPWAERLCKI